MAILLRVQTGVGATGGIPLPWRQRTVQHEGKAPAGQSELRD